METMLSNNTCQIDTDWLLDKLDIEPDQASNRFATVIPEEALVALEKASVEKIIPPEQNAETLTAAMIENVKSYCPYREMIGDAIEKIYHYLDNGYYDLALVARDALSSAVSMLVSKKLNEQADRAYEIEINKETQ